jgi:hypothetical protein
MSDKENITINELVENINKNVFNFHKVVHKLQQNYKTNKLNIIKLTNDIKELDEILYKRFLIIDNNLGEFDEFKEIKKEIEEIKEDKNTKNELEQIKLNLGEIKMNFGEIKMNNSKFQKKTTCKIIGSICINFVLSSILCVVFSKYIN